MENFLIVLASLSTGVAEIVTNPSVTEVVVGGSTFLNFSNDSRQKISCFRTQFGSTHETFIYRNDAFIQPLDDRLKMERNETHRAYKLVISQARITDAGIYRCQEATGQGSNETTQLIVLDSYPVCEPQMETHEIIGPNNCSIEPTELVLSCTVTYHGNDAPIMKWHRVSDNLSVSEGGVSNKTIGNNKTVYYLTLKGNSTANDGDSYFCNTTRSAISSVGCKSGKVKIIGKVVECPAGKCIASEICQPYIKPYRDAIICIFLIILPAAIAGTILLLWYLKIYRRKDNVLKGTLTCTQEAATTEEMSPLNNFPSSDVLAEAPTTDNGMNSHETFRLLEETNDRQSNEINDLIMEIEQLRNKNIDTNEKLRKLECEAADKIRQKSDEIERLQQINKVSDNEITQLKARVSDLERSLYPAGNIDYTEKPTLVHTIVTYAAENKEGKEIRKPINGMTILSKELFVSFEKNSKIEVYDAETFQLVSYWEILKVSHPMDMASCTTSNCIYVIHQEDNASESQIVKLQPKGQLITKWSTGGNNGRLSTYKSNVIVCLFEKQLINEYSGDGNLVHTVRLSPAVGFNHPWHAIKVTSSHFSVCHGDAKDKLHRVCIVDAEGNIIEELREWEIDNPDRPKTGRLSVPVCLVEDSERSILVTDRDNKKIRILNCFLKKQRSLIKKENGLEGHPIRICLDETKGRLYVAENRPTLRSGKNGWKDGKIHIFNIK